MRASVNWQRVSRQGWALLLIFILGLLARVALWRADFRFHEDEALYSFWALLIASGRDPTLAQTLIDKPPLFIYLLALTFKLLGHSEAVARLPGLLSSLVSIPLLYDLCRQLYDRSTALLATVLMALSPFNILFAPTVFIDPFLVCLVLASLWLLVRKRMFGAGLAIGLAVAAKQGGLLFVPLVLAVAWALARSSSSAQGAEARQAQVWLVRKDGLKAPPLTPPVRFVLGFLLVMLPIIWWDGTRLRRPGFLEQSFISYGGLELVSPFQALERLGDWLGMLQYVTASSLLNLVLLLCLPLLLFAIWRRSDRGVLIDGVLLGFVALYLLVHTVLSFSVWDRYLLGLVPLLSILLARGLLVGYRLMPPLWRLAGLRAVWPLTLFLLVALLPPAARAAAGGYPVGGDHGAYQGIEAVVAYLEAQAAPDSIIYHHWLGWHLAYYLFDTPLTPRWYPTPASLVADAQALAPRPRYLVVPSWKSETRERQALAREGLGLYPRFQAHRPDRSVSFTLYQIK
ncbi:MAG: ArnT family glycosyltransferase [Anaerolineae bacterium]